MKEDIKTLTIRLPAKELDILKNYCSNVARSQTEVVRELVRNLPKTNL